MRSSFSSYSSSPSSGYPLSYSSSSGGRRSSATPGFSLRSESSASSINSREPFSRGSRARDSLATRSFARGGGLERELSSRVSRDDHTSSLLERYGGSSSSAQKNHPGETSTMQLLRQRREQNDQGRRSSMDPHGESIFDNLFRDQPSTSWGFERTAPTRQTVPDAQDVNQSEYMNRLLAAHNRVDELLRSRGKNCEDERKYMRTWEEIPLIREERYLRLRTPSISSDSGLSTDNDSDKSNAEAANAASEEPHASDSTEKADETETETETEDSEHVINVPVVGESEEEEEEEAEIEESYHLKHEGTYFSAQITLPIKTQKESVSLSVRAVSDVSTSAECVVIARPVSRRKIFSMSERVTINEKAKLQCLAAEFSTKNMVRIMKKKAAAEDVSLVTPLRNDHARIKARFPLPADDSKNQVLFRRRSYDDSVKIQQKCVLASLKRRKLPSIPSSAEISIQHCSFYSQFAKDNFVEKNVRMNLRMTERAPKNCTVVISLPAPPRIQYASLDIPLKAPVRQLRRSQTLELTKKKKVGKLTRSFTMDIEKEEKEQRKVNRLVIPDFFLQSNAEALEEWKNSQGVKKVSIIGGFVITAAPKTSPQQQLRRAGAIRRRPPPQKEVTAPYLDFLPAEAKILPEVPKIRIVKPPDPDPPPLQPSRSTNQSTGHLNLHGSLERTVKPSGATKYESPITELSDADKILIEQYRQKLHIPKPRAIFRAISPIGAFRSLKSAFKERCSSPPPTEFIRAASPARIPIRSPEPSRKPFRLRNVAAQNKHVPRRHWLDFAVDLRKVDMKKHKERKLPRICTLKWIPKWRKRSDEEVEEVEEEEEVEVEEPSQLVDTPAVERPKTKSITEDDDTGLTEGEKAMAAAKRRQEDEDQAKLMDYEERRRAEREKEEEELKKLKEKQEKRRLEREQEEREMEERRKAAENRRREEEEEKKARLEEQRRKKEEEKNKRNQMIGGAFNPNGGRNFSIPKKSEKSNDKFGNIVQAKQEMGMTKDQQEEAKRIFIASVQKSILQASEISASDLKTKIKDLHARICKLEADKYDLEKRHERQKYDLKELNERQRQVARNSALKSGIDPADAGNSRYPHKVLMISKFERKSEYNFNARMKIFQKNQFPSDEKDLARGGARPPPEWGPKPLDEVLAYLNHPERLAKYSPETSHTPTLKKFSTQPGILKIPAAFQQH